MRERKEGENRHGEDGKQLALPPPRRSPPALTLCASLFFACLLCLLVSPLAPPPHTRTLLAI